MKDEFREESRIKFLEETAQTIVTVLLHAMIADASKFMADQCIEWMFIRKE